MGFVESVLPEMFKIDMMSFLAVNYDVNVSSNDISTVMSVVTIFKQFKPRQIKTKLTLFCSFPITKYNN